MAKVNLGQDVANRRERKWTATHIVAKSDPLEQAAGMRRYGSLINTPTPLGRSSNYEKDTK